MPRKSKRNRPVAVIDFETDPFEHGIVPRPFAAGFYDGSRYLQFWGDDCAEQLVAFLATESESFLIYAHNGGKFDFFFLLDHLCDPIKIINSRITKAGILHHELRDSFAIIPVPLAAYQKIEIDYDKFTRKNRANHREEILAYLKSDCLYLFELVSAFVERFGPKLTIGATAIEKLREICPFPMGTKEHDAKFRPHYFGGRVEFMKRGILYGDWKVYDVNSMYPYAMREFDHPNGQFYASPKNPVILSDGRLKGFGDWMYFAAVEGVNYGAFPIRKVGKLDFREKSGLFFVTSHEMRVAMQYGLFKIDRVHYAWVPQQTRNFADYVDTYVAEKIAAKRSGNKIAEMFSKFLLNSAYGKTAQNPENYFDYKIHRYGEPLESGWVFDTEIADGVFLMKKLSENPRYFDVAIGASITGAARSVLLEALHVARNPIYCDTDSVICEDLPLELSDTALGAWKLEGEGDRIAIAGKKLYALHSNGELVKMAAKGVRISDAEIFDLCRGKSATWKNAAPTFSLKNPPKFLTRTIAGVQ